ncbi:PREDICTED: uncharacterized protein LOC103335235 [Prunus mume]|uniref:Uncharacterized protein LOC103335235 n=1 Tax=Prunus mume TaxID=102107 RepID=A0ABM0P9X7_PRUMU|nr:PREDICTED: uncharacterized protein LOC103335235 [Prunus mume]
MVPPACLLGPPELHLDHPISTIIKPHEENPPLVKGRTFSSNPPLNPCLEFFFKATIYSGKSRENPDEAKAWDRDPLTTLKLIFCLRMAGRPNKEAFYKSLVWLHKNHPLTLALNLKVFVELGWFKDLLEILYRVLQIPIDEAKKEEEERQKLRNSYCYWPRYWCIDEAKEKEEKEKEEIKPVTDVREVRIARAKSAVDRYQNDPEYRLLHDIVSEVFVEILTSDLLSLESGEIEKISSVAKLCPSIDSSYDRETLICENIAKRMFPRHNFEEYKDVEEAHYSYRVRDRLRKQVLSPLRKALECSTAAKQNNKSSSSFKNRKALIALEIYRKIIGCGVGGGYDESKLSFDICMKLVDMLLRKKTIFNMCFGDQLNLPHQVVASLEKECGGCDDEIAELQWRRLVHELQNTGKLRNCIAVCDLPESKRGTLKEMVCISMGLLVSELSEKPWQGSVFSFSDFPRLHKIEGDNLKSKCEFMRQIECAEQVDFSKIFNQVLQIAIAEGNAKVPRRIFVFTYRDFEKASKNNWVRDFKEALDNYRKRGYFNVPHLMFWNLNNPIAEPEEIGRPVKNHNVGTKLTGFSNNLLSLFFKGEIDSRTYAGQVHGAFGGIDVLSGLRLVPKGEDVMKWAVSTEELTSLFVFD